MSEVHSDAHAEGHSGAHSGGHSVEEIRKHVRVYMMVFGSLAVLTIVTVAVGYLELPILPALIAALFIACIKGGLVASYFMHLIDEKKLIYWLLIATVFFLFVMFTLFISAYNSQEGGLFVF